jgi:hypothetical protein
MGKILGNLKTARTVGFLMEFSYPRGGRSGRLRSCSKTAKKFGHWRFHRFGNSQQGFDGNDFLAPFNFAYIFGIQVNQFCQLFLRQLCIFAMQANGFSNEFPVRENRLSFSFVTGHSQKPYARIEESLHQQHAGILLLLPYNRGVGCVNGFGKGYGLCERD